MKPLQKIRNMFCCKKRKPLDMNTCKMEQIISLFIIPLIKKEEEKIQKYKLSAMLLLQNNSKMSW